MQLDKSSQKPSISLPDYFEHRDMIAFTSSNAKGTGGDDVCPDLSFRCISIVFPDCIFSAVLYFLGANEWRLF